MGKILSSKRNNQKLVFELEVDHEEARVLQGHYDDIHIFSEKVAEFETNISSRGKNSVTKYFLIPKNIRKCVDFNCPVNCQKIETEQKIMFIYMVDKTMKVMKQKQ